MNRSGSEGHATGAPDGCGNNSTSARPYNSSHLLTVAALIGLQAAPLLCRAPSVSACAVSNGDSALLISQRDQRIDFTGPSGGDVAGYESDCNQRRRHGGERDSVDRTYAEQQPA